LLDAGRIDARLQEIQMAMASWMRNAFALAIVGWVAAVGASAEAPATDPLFKTVAGLDTALFDAYNHCDLAKLGGMVSDDLEFYHDKTGLAIGRQPLVDGVKNNICGKVQRELVAGSLEVYPLEGFGAVEIGTHRFVHPGEPGNVGEAKFVMIWKGKDGAWTLTRVISFDHGAAGDKAQK
jgi:hypothetical protein